MAALLGKMRGDIHEQGVGTFLDIGRGGISHIVPLEKGMVQPGMLIIAADTRCPALGCVGALSIALGAGFITVLVTGKAWLRIPTTILVRIQGKRQPGVFSRDIAQWLAVQIGPERGDYRVIEFAGSAVSRMGIDERHTLCNAMVDIGVKSAIVPADGAVTEYLHEQFEAIKSDPDATYESILEFDISELEPQICLPPSPDRIQPVSTMVGKVIHQAYIGSCISGKMEDLRVAADILRGRKVHQNVRMIIVPATQDIFKQALKEGLIEIFIDGGVLLAFGACGPCFGKLAPLCAGEVCIGTGTQNFPGRMGSEESEIYIASAATVAASAVKGVIADPREFLT
jgi:3-isopropylmalate/(R)-2-methylmalate dehydratase large subunit